MSEFRIMDLPELVYLKIIGYLDTKSYLRLRRVSKSMREWIDHEMHHQRKSKLFTGYYVQIQEPDKNEMTFENYLNSGLALQPNCLFHLKNTSMKIFDDPVLPQFLEKYGQKIRKLKVDIYNACELDSELGFYESLTNLEELELDFLEVDNKKRPDPSRLPEVFRKLRSLKLNGMVVSDFVLEFDYFWAFLEHCPLLETLPMPDFINEFKMASGHKDGNLGRFMDIVKNRMKNPQGVRIKFIDLENLDNYEERYALTMNLFTEFCVQNEIKLLNVNTDFFSMMSTFAEVPEIVENYDQCIISILDLHPATRILQLPHLDGIVIKSMKTWTDEDEEDEGSEWPLLKSVKIHFDVKSGSKLDTVYTLLIEDFDRSSVQNLGLSFERSPGGEMITESLPNMARSIVDNYENLKILSISGWDGMNKWFVRLWRGLSHLEELELEYCRTLGNSGFIGLDPATPIFLTLTKLRKLSLKGLDSMPKVTDRSFTDVFQHMNLSTLILTCDQPLTNVTREGISILASPNNAFSKSIDKFPFKGWKLAGETPETFAQLRDQFRCNQ